MRAKKIGGRWCARRLSADPVTLAAVLGNLLIDLREDRGLERAVRQSIDERHGVRQELADCQVRRNRTAVAGAKRRAERNHARRDDRRTDKARSEFLELAHADLREVVCGIAPPGASQKHLYRRLRALVQLSSQELHWKPRRLLGHFCGYFTYLSFEILRSLPPG